MGIEWNMYLQELKKQFKEKNNELPKAVQHRIYRTVSWLNSAEKLKSSIMRSAKPTKDKTADTLDNQFINLWIAFNAIYARQGFHEDKERFKDFISIMVKKEGEKLDKILWELFSDHIRAFLKNHYAFRLFWDFHNGESDQDESYWRMRFEDENLRAQQCLTNKNSEQLLLILFERIYTLRNQIFHGGSSFGGHLNREQLRQAANLLSHLVPVFALVVLNNPEDPIWGNPFYPVIEE